MRYIKTFFLAVLGGVCIAIGGTAFLSLDNKVLGSLFFSVGLFAICTMGLNLYTGKVCYVFQNDGKYALEVLLVWCGNFLGTFLSALALRHTRLGPAMVEKALALCQVKLNDSLLSIFILAVFCNMLIYLGVEGYRNNPHEIGKYLAIVFGVMVFILCGFEHCIANMFYFSVAGVFTGKMFVYLLIMTLGNAVGGVLFPLLRKKCQ